MSFPNPPHASRRRAYRRFSDERIWREFFCACLAITPQGHAPDAMSAARYADEAYAEYRQRFPAREPELDDEPEPAAEGARPS